MIPKIFFSILIIYTFGVSSQHLQKCSDGDPNACGKHSKCIDGDSGRESNEHGGAYCECLKEYYGPPPNCKRVCKTDCKPNEYCNLYEEACMEGCRSSDDCKNNEVCDDHVCVIYDCFEDSDCNSDESCIHSDGKKKCSNSCELEIPSYKYELPSISFPIGFESPSTTTKKPNADTLCGENAVCKGFEHEQYCSCIDGYFPEGGKGCRKRDSSDITPTGEDLDCRKYCGKMSLCKVLNGSIFCYCSNHSGLPYVECDTPQYLPPLKPTSDTTISLAAAMALISG